MTVLALLREGDAGARASFAALLALVLGLIISVVEPLLPDDGVEDTAPFVEAVRESAGELKAGDTVLIHPPWRDDVVTAVEQAHVLPRGARVTVALALPHGQDPGRVLLVQDPGAPPLPRARRSQLTAPREIGPLVVGWLSAGSGPSAAPSEDLAAQIANARVHVEQPDGALAACAWNDKRARHLCRGLADWMYVGVESHVVGGRPTHCVWSHPITGGKVVIRYENVRLGGEIVFSHALLDSAAGKSGGAPVTAELVLDGKSLGRSVRDNRAGWLEARYPVPAPGEPASLTLEITTPNDGARHYCWTLTSPGEGGAR